MEPIGAVLQGLAARHALAGRGGPPAEPLPGGTLMLESGPRHDPACPQCGGRGWWLRETGQVVPVRRRNAETKSDETVMVPYRTQVACSCLMQAAAVAQSPAAAGLGGLLAEKTLATFDPSDLRAEDWRAVRAWVAGLPGSLGEQAGWLCAGTTGNGKTHLAAALLHQVREAGARVQFVGEADLVRRLQATYHPDSDEREMAILDRLIAAPLLCLDDLGQAAVPGYADAREGATWLGSKVYTLLNGRMAAGRPTIITSNLKPALLAARLGDGATSRLDALRLVVFTGRDRR